MIRINKIYTKVGDTGKTQVIGGTIAKSAQRLEVCGSVDELNAWIGTSRTYAKADQFKGLQPTLELIQQQLFDLGAELATIDAERLAKHIRITPDVITAIEDEIDQITDSLPELTSFVLPGGTELNSCLHLARTVCRRAERALWKLSEKPDELIPPHACIYLNRLSDLLFALARKSSQLDSSEEFLWKN